LGIKAFNAHQTPPKSLWITIKIKRENYCKIAHILVDTSSSSSSIYYYYPHLYILKEKPLLIM